MVAKHRIYCINIEIFEKAMKTTNLYTCPECGLSYTDQELAKKCEAWCKKYNGCSLEITKHAVNKKKL